MDALFLWLKLCERISNYPEENLTDLWNRIGNELEQSGSMQEAAQICVCRIYEAFSESIVLARLFMTLAFKQLPEPDRGFVARAAEEQGSSSFLNDDTLVLSLLGTCGVESNWCDRYRSQGYLGIPLVTSNFVRAMPMVAKLMDDLGVGLEWLDAQDSDLVVRAMGAASEAFYVEDARTAQDEAGRRIVPRQDFVSDYDVRTVFGLGGCYVDGTLISLLLFTRESISRSEVDRFKLLFNEIKQSSVNFVLTGRIFGA